MTLRSYQAESVRQIHEAVRMGHRSILCVAPTGAGKTTIFCEGVIAPAAAEGETCWILVPSIQLVEQTSAKLRSMKITHGVIQGNHARTNYALPIQVGCIPSVASRIKTVNMEKHRPAIIVIDEAHRASDVNQFGQVIDWVRKGRPDVITLPFTATPIRVDGRGMGRIATHMVQVTTISELQRRGYLIPIKYIVPEHVDLDGIAQRDGDYAEGQLGHRMMKIVGRAVDAWNQHAKGLRTIVFCVNVAHAELVAEQYNATGIRAAVITAKTPTSSATKPPAGTREYFFRQLDAHEIDAIINVNVLCEGFDLPSVECVQMLRPTQSLGRYIQMGGRGLRPRNKTTEGGEFLTFIDQANLVETHGWLHEDRAWSLADGVIQPPAKRARQPKCPQCEATFRTIPTHCPKCFFPLDKDDFDPSKYAGDDSRFVEVVPETVRLEEQFAERQEFYRELEEEGYIAGREAKMVFFDFKKRYGHFPNDRERATSQHRIVSVFRHKVMVIQWKHEMALR